MFLGSPTAYPKTALTFSTPSKTFEPRPVRPRILQLRSAFLIARPPRGIWPQRVEIPVGHAIGCLRGQVPQYRPPLRRLERLESDGDVDPGEEGEVDICDAGWS